MAGRAHIRLPPDYRIHSCPRGQDVDKGSAGLGALTHHRFARPPATLRGLPRNDRPISVARVGADGKSFRVARRSIMRSSWSEFHQSVEDDADGLPRSPTGHIEEALRCACGGRDHRDRRRGHHCGLILDASPGRTSQSTLWGLYNAIVARELLKASLGCPWCDGNLPLFSSTFYAKLT